jgi:hypothetical protein
VFGLNSTAECNYPETLQRFCEAVLASDPLLAPYSNNYIGGHIGALEQTFPALKQLTGDTVFTALARVYLRHYPPLYWDINLYGDAFPELVGAQAKGSRGEDFDWPTLSTLAAVEYALTRLYYADNSESDPEQTLWVDAAESSLPDPGELLRPFYPFASFHPGLTLGAPVALWRNELRVQVANSSVG